MGARDDDSDDAVEVRGADGSMTYGYSRPGPGIDPRPQVNVVGNAPADDGAPRTVAVIAHQAGMRGALARALVQQLAQCGEAEVHVVGVPGVGERAKGVLVLDESANLYGVDDDGAPLHLQLSDVQLPQIEAPGTYVSMAPGEAIAQRMRDLAALDCVKAVHLVGEDVLHLLVEMPEPLPRLEVRLSDQQRADLNAGLFEPAGTLGPITLTPRMRMTWCAWAAPQPHRHTRRARRRARGRFKAWMREAF